MEGRSEALLVIIAIAAVCYRQMYDVIKHIISQDSSLSDVKMKPIYFKQLSAFPEDTEIVYETDLVIGTRRCEPGV